jgi:hypothetical protein
MLAYAGAALAAVERRLVELLMTSCERSGADPRGPMWCAAQSLDVTALVWHRVQPDAGRRFDALGTHLQLLHDRDSTACASAARVATSARAAAGALEQIAVRTSGADTALNTLERATLELAAVGVRMWIHADTRRRSAVSRPRLGADRAFALDHSAAWVADRAAAELTAATDDATPGHWLAAALVRAVPAAALAVIEDASAGRVLSAEAIGVVRAAWISRGALELLALRAVADESRAAPRPQPDGAVERAALAQAANRPVMPFGTSNARAWRAHSLALARAVRTYIRGCAANDGWTGHTRSELSSLLADSLSCAADLDDRHTDRAGL